MVLFSDLSMHELEVLPRDLQLCSDMATGVDSLGQFQWGDLVQLDAQTVGVIVRLERENFHVLSMHGKVVEARPQGLTKRRENRNAVALDSQQNTIQKKDIVKVVDGPHAGRGGEIKHLYRSFAFLHSRMFVDNGGIFVCKTRHLQLSGGTKTNATTMSAVAGFMSPRIASPMHPSGLVSFIVFFFFFTCVVKYFSSHFKKTCIKIIEIINFYRKQYTVYFLIFKITRPLFNLINLLMIFFLLLVEEVSAEAVELEEAEVAVAVRDATGN